MVFAGWRAADHSFDIERISSSRSELPSWAAVLTPETLGTSLGDFVADESGLGYAGGAVLVPQGDQCLALVAAAKRKARGGPSSLLP